MPVTIEFLANILWQGNNYVIWVKKKNLFNTWIVKKSRDLLMIIANDFQQSIWSAWGQDIHHIHHLILPCLVSKTDASNTI